MSSPLEHTASSSSASSSTTTVAPFCTSHFITGTYSPTVSFLDDTAYAKCLDTLVKACNDMLLTHKGKVFLGKRQVFPQKDWWYGAGGRMKPGESVFESVRRLLQRELKLDVSVEDLKKRLSTVGHYSFVWGKREQLPQTNGTADISVVVTMELTAEEVAQIKPHEFEQREWQTPNAILTGDYHPALVRSMQDYIVLCKKKELDSIINDNKRISLTPEHPLPSHIVPLHAPLQNYLPITDSEILNATRHYFQYCRWIAQRDTESVECKETV